MIIPISELSNEVLHNIAEEFVLREGTDYGELELSLEQKVARVLNQIQRNQVLIVYSDQSKTVNLMSKQDYQSFTSGNGN